MSTPKTEPTLRPDIFFAEKDQALREDVHRLGQLVGELVGEQGGEALFDLVEAARRASIAHREGDGEAIGDLKRVLTELAPRTARDFIRAFSTYFQMVNMAEKVHRIRRRRTYLRDTSTPQPYGFLDTLQRLKDAGFDAAGLEQVIDRVRVEPVFTAHPTETVRRTLLRKQQSIARHLVEMLDPYMTPQETAATLGRIRLQMTTGWQTEEHPGERRQGDETEYVMFFLTDVLYRMIPPFYESLENALNAVYGGGGRLRAPTLIKFATWIGGDMDGDPAITAKSIRETLGRQRQLVLNLYYNDCLDLARHLSQSEGRIGFDPEIKRRSEHYAGHFPQAAHAVPARHRRLPYRVFLRLVAARLQATYDDAAYPYESPEEFIADIELVADSLRANLGHNAGVFIVKRLLRRAHTFGFHMATLDIRQHALVHRRVIGESLGDESWLEASSEARTARLNEAFERRESPIGPLSSEARKTLAVFQTIAQIRRKYGQHALGPYIVSMAHGPDDVLSVLLLARWGDLGVKGREIPLDVAPLFETVDDLDNAAEIMSRLVADARYRKHLKDRGDRQFVMVGYSKSNQDGGIVSASWSLHKAQRALVETLAGHGIRLTLFHGRGGTISRGTARMHDAVRAAPRGAVDGYLRLSEQGEMINAKYGLRGIAMRSLEQTLSSVLSVTAMPPEPGPREREHAALMETIAAESRRAYQALVYDSGDFNRYFRDATPIDVIEHLGIGMKAPPSAERDLLELDATPWEFAWTQNRCLIPAWYGFARGVAKGAEQCGAERIRALYRDWGFFRVLVWDVEVALAKVDIDIVERYSRLAGPLHERFFPRIREEFQASVAAVLELTEQQMLLEGSDTLRRGIRLRNPYVDPMSLLQIDLLDRWRRSGRGDDDVLQALVASINGIAHGMQNTS